MRGVDGVHEELGGVGELGPRLGFEGGAQDVDRDLRGHVAVGVAAEAVGHREQRRVRRRPVPDAVLVALAPADPASLDDVHPAALSAARTRSADVANDPDADTSR